MQQYHQNTTQILRDTRNTTEILHNTTAMMINNTTQIPYEYNDNVLNIHKHSKILTLKSTQQY